MGKYTDREDDSASPMPGLGGSASAISLQTTAEPPIQRYFDDDPAELDGNDLPPLYTEHDSENIPPTDPLIPAGVPRPSIEPFRTDVDGCKPTTYYIDPRFNDDHKFLLDHLTALSLIPPRPYARIRGVHWETVKKGDKNERQQMVDFDIEVDLTSLCYSDAATQQGMPRLHTVSNFEKVHRGTVYPERAPGFGGSGLAEEGTPDAEQWCMRYALSTSGLKTFSYERQVEGWNWQQVEKQVMNLIKETNYRGRATVDFPIRNAHVEMYNDCRTNRWRLTRWIVLLFSFTLLFIFSWPWLFFRTKRYETVYSKWRIGRAPGEQRDDRVHTLTEGEWYNMWGRAIQQAIMKRRQGELTHADLVTADGATPRAEGFQGVVQNGIEAMNQVNRSFGWGADR